MERKQWSQSAQPLFFSTPIAEKDQCANFTPLSYRQAIFKGFSAVKICGWDKGMICNKKSRPANALCAAEPEFTVKKN
ncbi:hypothetical protein ACQE32_07950 [Pantoea sp. FN0302]|uniref:hypothetical protein n=1 Tax=Pantoea sp. FN0302 TaxID=3418558 RepID=UPI003CF3B700